MTEIVGAERDALILEILKRIEEAKPHADADAWERAWGEQLERFRAKPCEASLVPTFIKPDQPVRADGALGRGYSELAYVRWVHEWLSDQLDDCETVYEFGCGSGFNLVALSHFLPCDFCGFDASENAVTLVREAAAHFNFPIVADRFDMRAPSPYLLPARTGVFTFGAMEQLGEFKPFIEYLIDAKPLRVVHIEPIPELLDPDNLLDWLSLKFHEKRGYTTGLLPYLQAHPKIEVLKVERSHFGSLMLESYARIIWRVR